MAGEWLEVVAGDWATRVGRSLCSPPALCSGGGGVRVGPRSGERCCSLARPRSVIPAALLQLPSITLVVDAVVFMVTRRVGGSGVLDSPAALLVTQVVAVAVAARCLPRSSCTRTTGETVEVEVGVEAGPSLTWSSRRACRSARSRVTCKVGVVLPSRYAIEAPSRSR